MVNPAQARAKTHCKYDKTSGTVSHYREMSPWTYSISDHFPCYRKSHNEINAFKNLCFFQRYPFRSAASALSQSCT